MFEKKRRYNKEFRPCACGCGLPVRWTPSKPRKFATIECYRKFQAKVRAEMELQAHKNQISRREK